MLQNDRSCNLSELVRQASDLHRQADLAVETFRGMVDLACPAGCGHCCENPQVSSTETDFLPMAWRLLEQGAAAGYASLAEKAGDESRCVFYESLGVGRGRCSRYQDRPLVCRLFGFAGNRDKHSVPRLAACSVMKRLLPQAVEQAGERFRQGAGAFVMMADFTARLASVDPAGSRQILPINKAFRRALARVWLAKELADQSKDNQGKVPHAVV